MLRERQATDYKGFQDIIEREAEQLVGNHGAIAEVDERSPGGNAGETPPEVLVSEDRISAEEAELFKTSEEMKEPMMERKTNAEKWRFRILRESV